MSVLANDCDCDRVDNHDNSNAILLPKAETDISGTITIINRHC